MRRTFEILASIATVLVSVSAICLGIWSAYAERQHKKLEKLVLIDRYLHQTEFSDARSAVRQATAPATITDPQVRRVCSSFDFAAMLVRLEAIDKGEFVRYWRPAFQILAKRLKPVWDQDAGDGILAKDYYKDFYELLRDVAPQ